MSSQELLERAGGSAADARVAVNFKQSENERMVEILTRRSDENAALTIIAMARQQQRAQRA
jgi:hypothetical protein